MRKLAFFFIGFLLLGETAPATTQNFVVIRPDGVTKAECGADWSNACAQLPTILTRGTTYFLGSGSYPPTALRQAAGSGTITIKKATASDHGPNAGWKSQYGLAPAVFMSPVTIALSDVVFDGQFGGGPGNWKGPFGFLIDANRLSTLGMSISGQRVTVRHIEIEGNHGDGNGTYPDNDLVGIGTVEQFTLSYGYLHDAGRCIFFSNKPARDITIERVLVGRHESTSDEHSEIASLSGGVQNWTFRYNIFTHAEGTGGLIFAGDGLNVYGNVFVPMDGSKLGGGNGLIGTWTVSKLTNARIYNNTFINTAAAIVGIVDSSDQVDFKNNLLYKAPLYLHGPITIIDSNHFADSGDIRGVNATSQPDNPFTDLLGLDFRVAQNTQPGVPLPAPYNFDWNGMPRKTWTRGALEFGTASTTLPSSPSESRTSKVTIDRAELHPLRGEIVTLTATNIESGIVFNAQGENICDLIPNSPSTMTWNGRNRQGAIVASGTYGITVRSNEQVSRLKIVVVK